MNTLWQRAFAQSLTQHFRSKFPPLRNAGDSTPPRETGPSPASNELLGTHAFRRTRWTRLVLKIWPSVPMPEVGLVHVQPSFAGLFTNGKVAPTPAVRGT